MVDQSLTLAAWQRLEIASVALRNPGTPCNAMMLVTKGNRPLNLGREKR